jgi:hypothetical protein
MFPNTRGLEKGNVYVTGAGLFPTAGSWNRKFHSLITITVQY